MKEKPVKKQSICCKDCGTQMEDTQTMIPCEDCSCHNEIKKTMQTNLKVTEDLISYIKHLDTISSTLKEEHKKELENILRLLLVILIALKKGTGLGTVKFDFE